MKREIIKRDYGDGKSLEVVMTKSGKRIYVTTYVFEQNKKIVKMFYKRLRADKHYKKVLDEF